MLSRPCTQLVTLLAVLPFLAAGLTIPRIYARDVTLEGGILAVSEPHITASFMAPQEQHTDEIAAAPGDKAVDDVQPIDDDDDNSALAATTSHKSSKCPSGLISSILGAVFGGGDDCRRGTAVTVHPPPPYPYSGGSHYGGYPPGYYPGYNPYPYNGPRFT